MELTHTFTVPTPVPDTWAHFQDVAAIAECFPGAQVTAVEGDQFEGTCKVKLGPIALVYAGAGTFTERDEAAHRFVVEAKGKDKRGNGTAGATVTLTMAEAAGGTAVEVVTDLAITGKPAQFGRGVMQDVSDKLLGQFVACLEQRLAGGGMSGSADTVTAAVGPEGGPPGPSVEGSTTATPGGEAVVVDPSTQGPGGPPSGPGADDNDALDLGSALLPILLRSYGKQLAGALVGLLVVAWVVRRLRR